MKGKKFKYMLKWTNTSKSPMRTNKMMYSKKVDAEYDKKKLLKDGFGKNPRIKKL